MASRKKSAASKSRALIQYPQITKAEIVQREIRQLRAQISMELASYASSDQRSTAAGQGGTLGIIDEERVPELKSGHGRIGVFDQMVYDPHVRGQLRQISMTLISGV